MEYGLEGSDSGKLMMEASLNILIFPPFFFSKLVISKYSGLIRLINYAESISYLWVYQF